MRFTIRLFIVFLGFAWLLATGLPTPAMAAEEKEKNRSNPSVVEGQIQLEGQKPCPSEAANAPPTR